MSVDRFRTACSRPALVLTLLLLAPGAFGGEIARPLRARVTAAGWLASLEGFLQTPTGGERGTTTPDRPTTSEIGLDGLNVLPTVDTELIVLDDHGLRFSFVGVDLSGDDTLRTRLVSQGQTFPAGARVRGGLEVPVFRFGYRARWLPILPGGWVLGPEIGAGFFDFRYTLSSPSASGPVDRQYSAGYPYIGLLAEGPLIDRVALEADLTATGAITDVDQVDAELRLVYMLHRRRRVAASLVLGLRGMWLHRRDDQRDEQNKIDLRMGSFSTAPWAGLTFGLRLDF
jgi:hypothetical protein